MFVLDEADEMLSRGFKNQIYEVFKTMPQDVQVGFSRKKLDKTLAIHCSLLAEKLIECLFPKKISHSLLAQRVSRTSSNLHSVVSFAPDAFRNFTHKLQVILLSATMPSDVLDVTECFMRDPIRILVKKEELTLEGIRQFYVNVQKNVCYFLNSNYICKGLQSRRN